MAWIYALSDPRTPYDYRYVGRTTWEVSDRVAAHVRGALSRRADGSWRYAVSHKIAWIRALARDGYRPHVSILAEVPRATRIVAEQQWIAALREAGYRLTNATAGGEGPERYKPTGQTRRRQSESGKRRYIENPAEREFYRQMLLDRYSDPSQRELLAEQARQQWAVPGARDAQSQRLKEICAAPGFVERRADALRRTLNETERGAAIRKGHSRRLSGEGNHQAKLTWPIVRRIRALYTPGVTTQAEIAREFGVTQTLVGQIVRGKVWANDPQGIQLPLMPERTVPIALTPELLREVAAIYRSGLAATGQPLQAVAAHFGVTAVRATSWVAKARRVGFIGPTTPGRAGELSAVRS